MLIFLYGQDSFRSSRKLLEIKKKFLASDPVGSGLSVFDFQDKGSKEKTKLLDVFGMPNLLAPKRLIIIKNLLSGGSADQQKEVTDFLKFKATRLSEDRDIVAVFWEADMPKKSQALFKFLEKNSKNQNFQKLPPAKISQWVLFELKEIDSKSAISKSALDMLIAYTEGDTRTLRCELEKLANFAAGRMIEEQDVELLVRAKVDASIFATIDALAGKDKKTALTLLHRHIAKGEDPLYLLTMIVYQFRNILQVADLREQYAGRDQEVSRLTKLHPFVVRKSITQSRNFTFKRLKEIYKKLSVMDTHIKTGRMQAVPALERFIIQL